jgi:two-component system nitrogen regulation sensor histidine kinase NtrY
MDDILWLNREQCRSARHPARLEPLRRRRAAERAGRQLMEQALLNIVKNAIEAVDEPMRATAARRLRSASSSTAGERVRLSVIDSGACSAMPCRRASCSRPSSAPSAAARASA